LASIFDFSDSSHITSSTPPQPLTSTGSSQSSSLQSEIDNLKAQYLSGLDKVVIKHTEDAKRRVTAAESRESEFKRRAEDAETRIQQAESSKKKLIAETSHLTKLNQHLESRVSQLRIERDQAIEERDLLQSQNNSLNQVQDENKELKAKCDALHALLSKFGREIQEAGVDI